MRNQPLPFNLLLDTLLDLASEVALKTHDSAQGCLTFLKLAITKTDTWSSTLSKTPSKVDSIFY